MIRFECDYSNGCHRKILEALQRANCERNPGYGLDSHCKNARNLIRSQCGLRNVDVHFLVGGTQANMTVIASILKPWQGVLCADTGHIACHETGAIEAAGHKILPLPGENGKISAAQVRQYHACHWNDENHEHLVQPGMVYISQPTEYGTVYALGELKELYAACRELGLPLFIDGARLGYALAADSSISMADIAANCDVFYIGGTKVGALFGEAVVICSDALKRDFRYIIKQRGGMLAKGWLLGLQFETLFTDGLYYEISRKTVEMAELLRRAFEEKGIKMLISSPTNQLFPILSKNQQKKLGEKYAYCRWEPVDTGHDAVRFCISWCTDESELRQLVDDIKEL